MVKRAVVVTLEQWRGMEQGWAEPGVVWRPGTPKASLERTGAVPCATPQHPVTLQGSRGFVERTLEFHSVGLGG